VSLVAPTVALPLRSRLATLARRVPVQRIAGSLAVGCGTTLLSMSILVVLTASGLLAPAPANLVAVVAGIGPSFFLQRRFVWRQPGRGSLGRQVVPFWVMSIAALVLSTAAVGLAGQLAAGFAPLARSAVLVVTNLLVFGSLWLAQFLVLDRVLFARPASATGRPPA
jgi:putative flippase GtrA